MAGSESESGWDGREAEAEAEGLGHDESDGGPKSFG